MPAPKSAKRSANTGRLLGLSLVVGLLAGGVAAAVSHLTPIPAPIANAGAMLIVGALGLWWSRNWWLSVDEGVREAHKFGWFWGGSAGLLVSGAIALGLQGLADSGVAQFGIAPRDAGLVAMGAFITLTLMIVGYGVGWAGWWIARR